MEQPAWPQTSGIYRIRLSDRHFYYGRASNFRVRWLVHLKELRRGTHQNKHMQSVFDLHRVFIPEVVLLVESREEQMRVEQTLLDEHVGKPECLNLSPSSLGVPFGYKHSEETKTKLRGGVPTEETRRRLSQAHMGHPVSAETRERMSKSLKGKSRPDTTLRNKENVGWKHTDEAREKIRAAGHRPCADTTKQKIRENHQAKGIRPPTGGMRGHKHSEDAKQKISQGQKKREDMTPEERLRRSEMTKRGWATRRSRKAGG